MDRICPISTPFSSYHPLSISHLFVVRHIAILCIGSPHGETFASNKHIAQPELYNVIFTLATTTTTTTTVKHSQYFRVACQPNEMEDLRA